jgi:hypothetical protein
MTESDFTCVYEGRVAIVAEVMPGLWLPIIYCAPADAAEHIERLRAAGFAADQRACTDVQTGRTVGQTTAVP